MDSFEVGVVDLVVVVAVLDVVVVNVVVVDFVVVDVVAVEVMVVDFVDVDVVVNVVVVVVDFVVVEVVVVDFVVVVVGDVVVVVLVDLVVVDVVEVVWYWGSRQAHCLHHFFSTLEPQQSPPSQSHSGTLLVSSQKPSPTNLALQPSQCKIVFSVVEVEVVVDDFVVSMVLFNGKRQKFCSAL